MEQDHARITEVEAPELPERLGRALRARSMNRKMLAQATGISKNTLTAWGRGAPRVQMGTLGKVAAALEIDVGDIIGPVADISQAPRPHLSSDSVTDLAALVPLLERIAETAPDLMGSLAMTEKQAAQVRARVAPLLEVADRLRVLADDAQLTQPGSKPPP